MTEREKLLAKARETHEARSKKVTVRGHEITVYESSGPLAHADHLASQELEEMAVAHLPALDEYEQVLDELGSPGLRSSMRDMSQKARTALAKHEGRDGS